MNNPQGGGERRASRAERVFGWLAGFFLRLAILVAIGGLFSSLDWQADLQPLIVLLVSQIVFVVGLGIIIRPLLGGLGRFIDLKVPWPRIKPLMLILGLFRWLLTGRRK